MPKRNAVSRWWNAMIIHSNLLVMAFVMAFHHHQTTFLWDIFFKQFTALSMLPHFSYMSTKAFYQTVHYLAAIAKTLKQTCLWTSYGCLEKIYQSIMVSNSIDKAVNCFKKCLKEMWSHGDGMPWQSIAICLSWHSITMRLHFFETFFSSNSLPCLCYHIFHTCLPKHFIK